MTIEKEVISIRAHVTIGLVGCEREEIIDFSYNPTDEEIEGAVRAWVWSWIDYHWCREPKNSKNRSRRIQHIGGEG